MKPMHFEQLGMSSAVTAALRTGLLVEIATKPASDRELAQRLGLDLRATSLVLDVLQSVELVRRDGEKVLPGKALEAALRGPGGHRFALEMWGHTESFLRTGEPYTLMDLSPEERERAYQDVVSGLAVMFQEPARELAGRLSLEPRRILDVGCGSGVWGLSFAERHEDAIVTGLDLPAVLKAFESRAKTLSLIERVRTIPGDMHEAPIPPAAFDLVILANVLRLEPPARAESVLRRAAGGVAPGGALLVVDALAGGTPEREHARALYALHLGLRTKSGQVHRPEAITAWLTQAGLQQVTAIDIADGQGGLGGLLAHKNS